MKDSLKVTLGGECWTINFTNRRTMPKGTWGDCDWDLKQIRVRRDLSQKNFLDTLIHEIRHAQHPVLFEAEEYVTSTSTELAHALLATEAVVVFRW